MSELPQDSPRDADDSAERSGGVDFEGDVTVGGDVAGRDVVKIDDRDVVKIDDRDVVHVGYSAKAVQRLLITVGVLVFATAACFFSGGIVVGAVVFDRLNEPVNSSQAAAASMQDKLIEAQNAPRGEPYPLQFSEEELSSYVRFIAGPNLGLSDGKARFLEPGRVAIGGRLQALGDLPIAATFSLQSNSEEKVKLESAAVQVLPSGGNVGWVAVPNFVTEQFANQVDEQLGGGYEVTGVQAVGASQWTVTVEGR